MTQENRDRFAREALPYFRYVDGFRRSLDARNEWNWIQIFRDLKYMHACLYAMESMLREMWWEWEERGL